MDDLARDAFLDQTFPTPLAVVGTLRGDGSPHLVPVWFRWDGASVTIWTIDSRLWVRNLRRDSRVALSVQTFEAPYPAVVLRGTAAIDEISDQAVDDEIRAITSRYIVAEDVETYASSWPELRTIVRVSPTQISSWAEGG